MYEEARITHRNGVTLYLLMKVPINFNNLRGQVITMERHFTREQLARRWSVSVRTIDRLRQRGQLPWIDLSGGTGARPVVRFKLSEIEDYELVMSQGAQKLLRRVPI
jgi:hypothetical protein